MHACLEVRMQSVSLLVYTSKQKANKQANAEGQQMSQYEGFFFSKEKKTHVATHVRGQFREGKLANLKSTFFLSHHCPLLSYSSSLPTVLINSAVRAPQYLGRRFLGRNRYPITLRWTFEPH